jgi:hypothetical protein
MFEPFLDANPEDRQGSVQNRKMKAVKTLEDNAPEVYTLLSQFGGKSFDSGLYRIHTFSSSLYWTKQLSEYFPNYPNVYTFAFDWAGCIYASGKKGKKTMLYLFDPADLQVHELQQSVTGFHNQDLVLYRDETLLTKKFKTALKRCNLTKLGFNECIAYKTSLFLAGKDTTQNRSLSSLEVYWHMQNELFDAIQEG